MSNKLESDVCYYVTPSGESYRGNRGLVESNCSLPPGGWLSHLPVHWDQLRTQRSETSRL